MRPRGRAGGSMHRSGDPSLRHQMGDSGIEASPVQAIASSRFMVTPPGASD